MATIVGEPETRPAVDPAAVAEIRGQLGGKALRPGDDGYDDARRLWNGMIDKRPAVVIAAAGAADVQRAVALAREQGLSLAIKGGGHNVAGHAIADGGVLLDLSAMRAVWVDPVARTARVQGGATWADFDRETGAFGLATTGGAISTTGVGGLTLGGGVGWLVGKHGLAVDNLRSVEVVTADGDVLTACPTEYADLFWALRGGGGNFGVATSFEFRLHPLREVLAGMVAYPAERARDVLELYREWTAAAPDELTVYAALMAEPESGARIAGLAICWSGDPAEGERVLAPLDRLGEPLLRMIGPMPYPVWQGANDPLFPHGRRYYWKGAMTRELPDQVLDAMAAYAVDPPLPWMNATIEFYAGAMNRVGVQETAYPHRDARYQVLSIGAWDDAADDEIGKSWVRGLHAATEAATGGGTFLNFVALDDAERQERVRAGFGPNWDRLVRVKQRYDPANLFHQNNNIAP